MVDGQETPSKRPAAPHLGDPLGGSGAAPEEAAAAVGTKPSGSATPAEEKTPSRAEKPDQAEKSIRTENTGRVDKPTKTEAGPADDLKDKDAEGSAKEEAGKQGKDKTGPRPAEEKTGKKEADQGDKPSAAAGDKEPAGDKAAPADSKTQPADGEAESADGEAESATRTKAADSDGLPAPSPTAVALASRTRAGRALRKASPARMARSTFDWARRPSGRVILPAIVAVLLLGAAGTAGAYLVPQALEAKPAPSATPAFGVESGAPVAPLPNVSLPPTLPGTSSAPAVGGGLPAAPVGVPGNRPADVLSGWAQQAGTRVGIPVVAVQAYGYAELVVARTAPSCHLSWTTIAAIAKVESAHGSANGAVLGVDGSVSPAIFGLPLDGKGGRQLIRDTDQGVLDKDTQYDRAMGPLQFIPTTWNEISVGNAVDADNNGVSDPNDIDDASLAAAVYLCKGGRDLSKADAWWDAILTYNAVRPYAQKVFDAANEYGVRSRT
ncbi:hypothetical protein [Couchioplanes caeruleus]|uniref:Membrane-bound lytic murein transglycosylase B n=1 Tax=Couchioplanes caeruleus subsp. caeruleus TaxID=56427 RepID=A0A1K0GVN5_9ACTN|nr:hypothetical protein [Couchioplanes caeruleus]OJF13451.1 hypothetical protein BG844_15165 [Couchioplanes caeruleus subsp. caeruleus]